MQVLVSCRCCLFNTRWPSAVSAALVHLRWMCGGCAPTLKGCCSAFSLSTTAARWPRLLATCSVLSILRPFLRHKSRTFSSSVSCSEAGQGGKDCLKQPLVQAGVRTAVCTAASLLAREQLVHHLHHSTRLWTGTAATWHLQLLSLQAHLPRHSHVAATRLPLPAPIMERTCRPSPPATPDALQRRQPDWAGHAAAFVTVH